MFEVAATLWTVALAAGAAMLANQTGSALTGPPILKCTSRRTFLQRSLTLAGAVLGASVLKPLAAHATHLRCKACCPERPYNTCIGACSCLTSDCCVTSPSGVYRDCCQGTCGGSGCCNVGYARVIFQLDDFGRCFCYLRTC